MPDLCRLRDARERAATRHRRGFTLVEMVVTMVMVGIVALIAIPTYRSHVVNVQDKGARNVVLQVAEDAQGLLEGEQLDAFSFAVVHQAVNGLPDNQALGASAGLEAGAGFTILTDGTPSTRWGEVSVSIARGDTASQLGIATLSRSGHCAKAAVPVSGAATVTMDNDPAPNSCSGTSAFPEPPDAVVAGCSPHDARLEVSWTPAGTGTAAAGYRVYRDGAEVTHVGTGTTSAEIRGLTNGQGYDISVRPVDAWGQLGPESTGASCEGATPTDDAAPDAPGALTATGGQRLVTLTWAPAPAADLASYRIFRGATQIASVPAGTLRYVDQGSSAAGLDPGTPPDWRSYSYTVKAVDTSGNISEASSAASATVTDGTAPDVPAPQASAGVGEISLSWDAVNAAAGDVSGYRVYRCTGASCVNPVLVQTLVGPQSTSWTNTGLDAGTYYKYWVSSYDASGNESAQGGPAGTTTVVLPEAPSVTATPESGSITWSWTAPDGTTAFETTGADEHTGTTAGAADGTDYPTGTTSITTSGLSPATSYTLGVRACSTAGCSEWTTTSVATLPGAPTGVQAGAGGARRVTVSWTAPSGTLSGYTVYRSSGTDSAQATKVATIPSSSTHSYVDTELENATTYSYWVRATNASGEGAFSSRAEGTTLAPPGSVSFQGSACPTGYDADASPSGYRSVDHPTSCLISLVDDGTATSWSMQVSGPEGFSQSFTTNQGYTDPLPYAGDEDLRLELTGSACNDAGCTDAHRVINAAPQPEAPTVTKTGCGAGLCSFTISGRYATSYEVNVTTSLQTTTVSCADADVVCSGGAFGAGTNGAVNFTGEGPHVFHIDTRCAEGTAEASGCSRTVYVSDGPGVKLRAAGTSKVWWLSSGWCMPPATGQAPSPESCQFSSLVSADSAAKPSAVSFAGTRCPSYFDGSSTEAWRSVEHPDECTYLLSALDATSYSYSVTNEGSGAAATYTDTFSTASASSKLNGKTLPYAAERDPATGYHLTLTGQACNANGCTTAADAVVYALPRPGVPTITKGACGSGLCSYSISGAGATHYEVKLVVLAGTVTVECADAANACQGDSFGRSSGFRYDATDAEVGTKTFGPGTWRFRIPRGCAATGSQEPTGCTRSVRLSAGGLLYAAGAAEMWPATSTDGGATDWAILPGSASDATDNPHPGSRLGWCLRTEGKTPPSSSGTASGEGWLDPSPSSAATNSCSFSEPTSSESS